MGTHSKDCYIARLRNTTPIFAVLPYAILRHLLKQESDIPTYFKNKNHLFVWIVLS